MLDFMNYTCIAQLNLMLPVFQFSNNIPIYPILWNVAKLGKLQK